MLLLVGQLIELIAVSLAVRFRPFSCDPSVVTGCRLLDENRSVEGRFEEAPFVAGGALIRNGLVDDCGRVLELGMTLAFV